MTKKIFLSKTGRAITGSKRTSIAGWVEVGGQKFYAKSLMEYHFACYLEWQKTHGYIHSWAYEPKTFWFNEAGANLKRGTVSYKPDFMVYSVQDREHTVVWYEVKGYMDKRSQTKIKRFRKYFPKENLIIIDQKWFQRNSKIFKGLVPGWK